MTGRLNVLPNWSHLEKYKTFSKTNLVLPEKEIPKEITFLFWVNIFRDKWPGEPE
jgi:hypothetical protein